MKVKPNQKILFYDGSPLKDPNGNEIFVKDAVINAVNTMKEGKEMPGTDKSLAFQISVKMYDKEEEVDLDIKEISFILTKAEESLVPLVYGRLKELFDK